MCQARTCGRVLAPGRTPSAPKQWKSDVHIKRSSYGWLVSNTVDECLPSQIAQKIFRSKIEARPVNAGHYMAFKHRILFATNLAANFRCDRFRITSYIVSKLLCAAIWSRCAVRFESEQTPFQVPRTGRRLRSAALHRIRFGTLHRIRFGTTLLFLCHIFTKRPMNDRKIEQIHGRGFGRQQLLAHSMEISFPMKKKSVVTARYLQRFKPFLIVELSQFRRRGSTFSSSEPVAARSDCRRLRNTLCLCSPVQPAQAVPDRGPKSSAIDFCSQLLRLSSGRAFGSDCQMTGNGRQGLEAGLKLELCRLTNGL